MKSAADGAGPPAAAGGRRKSRPYRKRRRAEAEERTRERIAAAAAHLHGTVGPARTTIKAVADEAGVQRSTVYRHFPDEEALFQACSAHYFQKHPIPDPSSWATIDDPDERLSVALTALYEFYAETREMLERTSRDLHLVPAMQPAADGFAAYLDAVRSLVMEGRPERGDARRLAEAVTGHLLSFQAWHSLVCEQGLAADEAVAFARCGVACAAAVGDEA